MAAQVVISCEHASAAFPRAYRALFADHDATGSHRGYDAGAWPLAQAFAAALDAPLHRGTHNRLLIDLNRAPRNPRRFSARTAKLPRDERDHIQKTYYAPYRDAVTADITRAIRRGRVLHLGVHTFIEVWRGRKRHVDVGLLYDPQRPREKRFCSAWRRALEARIPELCVRFNAPYRGVADGFPYHLRKSFTDQQYAGLELEVNQRHIRGNGRFSAALTRALVDSFTEALRTTAR